MCFVLKGHLHSISHFTTKKDGKKITQLHVFHTHGNKPEVTQIAHFGKTEYKTGVDVEIPVVIRSQASNGRAFTNFATFD